MPVSSKSSSFLSLPTEVRLLVCRHLFRGQVLARPRLTRFSLHSAVNVLLACKQLHREVRDLLFEEAHFWIDACDLDEALGTVRQSPTHEVFRKAQHVIYSSLAAHSTLDHISRALATLQSLSSLVIRFRLSPWGSYIKSREGGMMSVYTWLVRGCPSQVLCADETYEFFCCFGAEHGGCHPGVSRPMCDRWIRDLHD